MPNLRLDLFVEDSSLEQFLSAVILRVAAESQVRVEVRVRQSRGGAGKLITEFKKYQQLAAKGASTLTRPDVLVVGRDANCAGANTTRDTLSRIVDPAIFPSWVLACPDPHIERWFLADITAVNSLFRITPSLPRKKCGKDLYKRLLEQELSRAGVETLLGGYDVASEIVQAIDLYRLGREDAAFRLFYSDLRAALAQAASA